MTSAAVSQRHDMAAHHVPGACFACIIVRGKFIDLGDVVAAVSGQHGNPRVLRQVGVGFGQKRRNRLGIAGQIRDGCLVGDRIISDPENMLDPKVA